MTIPFKVFSYLIPSPHEISNLDLINDYTKDGGPRKAQHLRGFYHDALRP